MRKVIQVVSGVRATNEIVLVALCDDGTLWTIGSALAWHGMPPIPQDGLSADDWDDSEDDFSDFEEFAP